MKNLDTSAFSLVDYEAHEKAVKAYKRSVLKEAEWKQLVAEGKARCIKTPVIGGFRYHYELIK